MVAVVIIQGTPEKHTVEQVRRGHGRNLVSDCVKKIHFRCFHEMSSVFQRALFMPIMPPIIPLQSFYDISILKKNQ